MRGVGKRNVAPRDGFPPIEEKAGGGRCACSCERQEEEKTKNLLL